MTLLPYCHVYADGSKMNDGVGCAVVLPGETFTFSLNKNVSIHMMELSAIHQALY